MAAGAVIIREAGGHVMGMDGQDFDLMARGVVVAASRELAKEITETVKIYKTGERDLKEAVYAWNVYVKYLLIYCTGEDLIHNLLDFKYLIILVNFAKDWDEINQGQLH